MLKNESQGLARVALLSPAGAALATAVSTNIATNIAAVASNTNAGTHLRFTRDSCSLPADDSNPIKHSRLASPRTQALPRVLVPVSRWPCRSFSPACNAQAPFAEQDRPSARLLHNLHQAFRARVPADIREPLCIALMVHAHVQSNKHGRVLVRSE